MRPFIIAIVFIVFFFSFNYYFYGNKDDDELLNDLFDSQTEVIYNNNHYVLLDNGCRVNNSFVSNSECVDMLLDDTAGRRILYPAFYAAIATLLAMLFIPAKKDDE